MWGLEIEILGKAGTGLMFLNLGFTLESLKESFYLRYLVKFFWDVAWASQAFLHILEVIALGS